MGCSSSIHVNNDNLYKQQPMRAFNNQQGKVIIQPDTKIIKLAQNQQIHKSKLNQNENKKFNNSTVKNDKSIQYKKKQEQIKYLKNNKDFVQLSIQTSYCVNRVLNALAQNEILQDRQLKTLISKNNKILQQKQNRYKNLQKRQQKIQNELKKHIIRTQRVPKTTAGIKPFKQRRNSQLNNSYDQINIQKQNASENEDQNKQNINNLVNNTGKNNYKSKFISKIDKFRSQVNSIMKKDQLGL